MGEESTTPVYVGKYGNGAIKFEYLGEIDDMNIEKVEADDIFKADDIVKSIGEPITVRAFLQKKGLRGFYKAIGMPAYLRTEYLFPKKKKRGTARRKRRMKRAEQSFINFIRAKYCDHDVNATRTVFDQYIISKDELPAFAGPFEGEEN